MECSRHTIQADYIDAMDEIAELLGTRPNLLSLAFTDPKLALKLVLGPCTPVQFRLQGPGKWDKARETILTTEDRIKKPLMTRTVENSSSMTSMITMTRLMQAAVLFAIIVAYFELF